MFKHDRCRNQGGGGGGGVAVAPLKIGINSTKLTGREEHFHFTRRVKKSPER